MNKQFNNLANGDVSWAAFSILFVVAYLCFHLRSVFLAINSIFLILFCFPVTALINMGIFQNTYYSTLHSLAIFIVLGIAADDIFVFIDGWRQSATNPLICNN
jgi:protein dispatched 1